MSRAVRVVLLILSGAVPCAAPAADEPLEEIIVTGEFAGPGMWRVSKDEHSLWIVGDPPPLPKRMSWKSRSVEAVVLRSQEVLLDAGVTMKPDEEIGFFKGLSMVPAAMKARKNPDEAELEDLLPPDVYARWLVQKKRFLGRDGGVEEWRPLFAADKLRKAAYKDLGLRESGMVWEVVEKLIKKNKIRTTTPRLTFTIKASEIKTKIKEFQRETLPDVDCLAATVALTEALSNKEVEAARARAWATADLAALEALPALPNAGLPCITAVMSAQAAKEAIPADIREQLQALWVADAERALAANETTFAIVPLAKLLQEDGYLARLRARGYAIEPPR
jgi:hypothetical protein